MGRFLAIVMFGSVAIAQVSFADARSKQQPALPTTSMVPLPGAPGVQTALPPVPPGKSTVLGGAIRNVDPVRDQMTLKVFGGRRAMKILFDERTQVFRDGQRIPLRDLRPEAHASIETVLDGTNIFAVSIHILSRAPEGDYQGQVLSFNPATRELTVSSALSHHPMELRVPTGTPFVRQGQAASSSVAPGTSDLVKGTLVSIQFEASSPGRGVARQIAILATPGAAFVFTGNIGFLDLRSQILVVVDPRDGKSYKISFDPARFPVSRELHQGAHVTVTANFDGTNYVASAIKVS
ncbi:MAG: hypothetical protein ACYDC6_04040 [Acidobacteriaceae bacterium]